MLAVTLAVIAVFVPVAFMSGMVGRFFFQFGVTVAVAVAISYAVSMTLTPMMSARVLAGHAHLGRIGMVLEKGFVAIERIYRAALRWALAHRFSTMGLASLALAASVVMVRHVQFTFIPAQDMSSLDVTLELPLGTPLADAERAAADVSRQIEALQGIDNVFTLIGGGVDEAVNKATITVNMVPIAQRGFKQGDLKEYLRHHLALPPAALLTVADKQIVSATGNRAQPFQLNLRGDDWEQLLAAVEQVKGELRQEPGPGRRRLHLPGRPAAPLGAGRPRSGRRARPPGRLRRLHPARLPGPGRVREVPREGGPVRRQAAAPRGRARRPGGDRGADAPHAARRPGRACAAWPRLTATEGPSQIDRQALKRQVTLLADLKGMSLGGAIAFGEEVASKLPPGIQHDYEGQAKELGKTVGEFGKALLLGVILIYMVLAAQFESLLDPVTIMASLPLSVIGAFAALFLAGEYMSIFALIGMIMLMGLVAKNGILIVEFTNQLREAGRSAREALLEAGPLRLRPILMTSVAMIAGMIPVALARGDGAESRTGMAWAIIGGLVASTALTLVVVPVIYSLFDSVRRRHASRHQVEEPPADQRAA